MANTTHNTPEKMIELADYWEDEDWEQVIKESNLEAEIVQAKDRVVECAIRWHEYERDHTSSWIGNDMARADLNDACRDLQALKGN